MHKHLTMEALKALDAIDKKGSFAAAAESLYKVPSALTYTIKKLEQEVGCDLFDRSKQRAVLTPAGKLVLEQGREILLATNRLFDSVKQLESGWETEIRIARDTIISAEPLYSALNDFVALGTNVNVNLSVEALAGGWDALLSRRADIVIGAAGELPKGTFKTKHIGSVEFVFAVAAAHPLAKIDETIENSHLLDFPSVVVADTSQLLPTRNSGLFQSKQIVRVGTMDEKVSLQLAGAGVGFLPKHLISAYLKSGELVEKSCVIPRPQQELYIAWQKSSDGKALNWFAEKLSEQDWKLG